MRSLDALTAVLSQRVGFDAWDDALLSALCEDDANYNSVLAVLDDQQNASVEGLLTDARIEAGDAMRKLRLAASLAVCGGAIFVELAAHHLVGSDRALRVRLEPPLDATIAHHAAVAGLEHETARQDAQSRDKELGAYSEQVWARPLDRPEDHDLVLNSAAMDLYTVVELMIDAWETRFQPKPGWWHRPTPV